MSGNNFKMYNINIQNSAGDASQAVALSTRGTEMGFYACSFLGWQDTLYTHIGSQFFGRCYIEGAVDFIFGITGNSWFQGCTLAVLKAEGTITAQGRTSSSTTGFYVFNEA
jgi:pectinesterase